MFKQALALVVLALPMAAQSLTLDFAALAEKAKTKNEINLDGAALEAARQAAPDMAKLKDVQSVSVHNYEYAQAGDYPKDILDQFRKQVDADKRWSKVLSSHEEKESTDIYVMTQDGKLAGFLLINAEEKEVSVIQALGSIQLAQAQEVVNSAIKYNLAAVEKSAGK